MLAQDGNQKEASDNDRRTIYMSSQGDMEGRTLIHFLWQTLKGTQSMLNGRFYLYANIPNDLEG